MKLQQEDQKQARETSGPWDNWLRDQEHKKCTCLSFQLQGMMGEETERANRSAPGCEPAVTQNSGFFDHGLVRDGDPHSTKNTRFIDMLETMEAPEKSLRGMRASTPKEGSVIKFFP